MDRRAPARAGRGARAGVGRPSTVRRRSSEWATPGLDAVARGVHPVMAPLPIDHRGSAMTYAGEQPPTTPGQYQPPPARRAWLPWTIAGLAVLALAVVAVVFLVGRAGGVSASGGLSREV